MCGGGTVSRDSDTVQGARHVLLLAGLGCLAHWLALLHPISGEARPTAAGEPVP